MCKGPEVIKSMAHSRNCRAIITICNNLYKYRYIIDIIDI